MSPGSIMVVVVLGCAIAGWILNAGSKIFWGILVFVLAFFIALTVFLIITTIMSRAIADEPLPNNSARIRDPVREVTGRAVEFLLPVPLAPEGAEVKSKTLQPRLSYHNLTKICTLA